jgi:peptidoglycan/xylan/chitin deacetylase (PgdA/CDA1 family)
MENGKFVISLDFELHWGVADIWNLSDRKDYFIQTRESIPKVLNLFEKFNIHATWATVGFLFAKNRDQLKQFCPKLKPTYQNNILSNYNLFDAGEVGYSEIDDPFHYAHSIISQIMDYPHQEIASHTFSHFYCNESGQNLCQFEADLKAARDIALENFGIELQSLVFPRNQFNKNYIEILRQNGIKVIRSNPNVWFWNSTSKLMSLARALDTILPISTSLSFSKDSNTSQGEVMLLPASRFLRPFSINEKQLQFLKFLRIKKEMKYAAMNNKIYHLWWHPHNFGNYVKENLEYLEMILLHYECLNKKYNFESQSMIEMY